MKKKITKKIVSTLVAAAMSISLAVSPVVTTYAAAPSGWNDLLDITIYDGASSISGWTGAGANEIETVNANLPVDTTQTYNGMPSLRINVTKEVTSGWWVSLVTVRDWCTHDISQYIANGFLEFNVKGKTGGEDFTVGLRDKVNERATESLDNLQPVSKYVTITNQWQHVKVPLKDLADTSAGFDPTNIMTIVFSMVNTKPFTAWVNDIKITSPDKEKSYAPIKVNQVGYLTASEKYAFVSGFEDELTVSENTSFELRSSTDNKAVYTGKLSLVKEYDAIDSGEKVFKADFSSVTAPGKYYVYVNGLQKSVNFTIGNDIYKNLLVDASRYFYLQRANIELTKTYSPDYPRKDKTPMDSAAKSDSNSSITRDVTKGWYDAGDFGKYVNAGATALSDLFWSYEMMPEQFTDNQFNIPESRNGIPDILDESRWELEWMLKMQDESSGGFYARVQSNDDTNITSRIIKDKNSASTNIKTTDDTACAAAVLAHAYLLYKDIDSTFAAQCLAAAKKAWSFLEKNPNNIISPPGPYNVSNDKGDRLWAAASLYRATGDETYHTYFKNNYKSFASKFEDPYGYAHSWGDNWMTAFFCYMKASNRDSNVDSWFASEFDKWTKKILNRYNSSTWKNAIVEGNYFWGINMQVMNVPMDAYIGSKLLNTYTKDIDKFALGSMNWLLGANPISKSFVTGYGENAIKTIFSNIYSYDNLPGIPKGYLAGGPNRYEGKGISRFAAKCYIDSATDWVTNEHTIYWNSPLVFMSALANKTGLTEDPGTDKITITGKVRADVDSSSSSINAGFTVKVSGKEYSTKTTSDGSFKLELPVIPGSYDLEISKTGYLTRKIQGIAGNTDKNLSNVIDIWAGDVPDNGITDNAINIRDIMKVAGAFNTISGDADFIPEVDFNLDGAVNIIDIMIVVKHFNRTDLDYTKYSV